MSGLAFVTHPSVRIKGTENSYEPVQCVSDVCVIKTPHLHCPFCVKTESYADPVILKAHYRVKHVDKGIDFAGLKILRCCEHCDIVGVIKGEKKFKGAHWHCYRCRNGFNRRDEAIKHYKTHFRNPQTTFQISITQDLNSPVLYNQDSQSGQQTAVNVQSSQANNRLLNNSEVIHPALTEAVSCISISSPVSVSEQDIITSNAVTLTNGKEHGGALHESTEAACESVNITQEDEQAIVIIQEEALESSEINSFPTHIISSESVVSEKEDKKEGELAVQVQRLEQERAVLKAEIVQLHNHVEKLQETIRAGRKREEELSARLSKANNSSVADVLKRMEQEHRNLLRQQLDTLQQMMLSPQPPTSTVLQLTDQHGQQIHVVSAASLEAFLVENITTTSSTEGQTTLPTTSVIQTTNVSLEQITGSKTNSNVTTINDGVVTAAVELDSSHDACSQNMKVETEGTEVPGKLAPKHQEEQPQIKEQEAKRTDSEEQPPNENQNDGEDIVTSLEERPRKRIKTK